MSMARAENTEGGINGLPVLRAAFEAAGVDPDKGSFSMDDLASARRVLIAVERQAATLMGEHHLLTIRIGGPEEDE